MLITVMMMIKIMNGFCGMADLRIAVSRIAKRDHHQEASPS